MSDTINKTYCDWRFEITGCEYSEIFARIYEASIALSGISVLVIILLLGYRFFIRKDGLSSLSGANGSLIIMLLALVADVIYPVLLITPVSRTARQIFWAFYCTWHFILPTNYMNSVFESLPQSRVPKGQQSFLQTKKKRRILNILYYFLLAVPYIALFIAYAKLDQEEDAVLGHIFQFFFK